LHVGRFVYCGKNKKFLGVVPIVLPAVLAVVPRGLLREQILEKI
jgi:hypothetical protein